MITSPTYADVAALLDANGLGQLGVDLFGGEWGEPDAQVLCLEGVGVPSEIKDEYEQPAVQVLVRGKKRQRDMDVYARAKAISDFLLAQPECFDVGGVGYLGFEEASNVAPLGKDSNERFIYSMNFQTWRNRT